MGDDEKRYTLDEMVKRLLLKIACWFGSHRHCEWREDGLLCRDCGWFFSKEEIMAEMQSGRASFD